MFVEKRTIVKNMQCDQKSKVRRQGRSEGRLHGKPKTKFASCKHEMVNTMQNEEWSEEEDPFKSVNFDSLTINSVHDNSNRDTHIVLDPTQVPVVHAPQKCPIKLSDDIKMELDEMERIGVIKKVSKPTDWVNSAAYSQKSSGR